MATFTLDAVIALNARVSQAVLEVLVQPSDESARVSQAPLEVLVSPTDEYARVSQAPLEVLVAPQDQMALVSQSVFEVLIKQPIVGSKSADAVVKAHMSGSQTIDAVIKTNIVRGTWDVTYEYPGPSIKIYTGHTKTITETVFPGCDLTIVGSPITIVWDVWQSHFQWAQDKKEVFRLRRDSVTGLTLVLDDPQRDGSDAGNDARGHEWHDWGWYRETARSGRYVLTIKPAKGNATLYSDSIYFSLQTPGIGPGITLDAAIVKVHTKTFRVGARLKKFTSGERVMAFDVDAIIGVSQIVPISLDATLFLYGLGAIVTNAVIGKTSSGSFSVGAQVVTVKPGSLTVDAKIRSFVTGNLTIDATKKGTQTGSLLASAIRLSSHESSLTVASIFALPRDSAFSVDAVLEGFWVSLDAYVLVPSAGAFTVDSWLWATVERTLAMDAALVRSDLRSLTVDADIIARSFSVQGAFE